MTFGKRVRELRKAKALTLRSLAEKVKVNFTYLSKIENHKLDFGDYPGEGLIRKPAKVLGADEDELLLMAEKIPDEIRKRVVNVPTPFASSPGWMERRSTGWGRRSGGSKKTGKGRGER